MNTSPPSLRRRRVVQLAIGYAAVAFTISEVFDLVAEPWAIPSAYARPLHVALAAGFLLTLIIAFHHGERGTQKVTPTEVVLLVLVLIAGGLGIGFVWSSPDDGIASVRQANATDQAVAVLPFENLSPGDSAGFFADGVHEGVLTSLAQLPQLTVRGQSSVMAYRNSDKPLPEIGRELRVRFVISGSATMVGSRVRIRAQLVDAILDEYVWSSEFDRELTIDNMLDVQAEIVAHVARAATETLVPTDVRVQLLRSLSESGDWDAVVALADTLPAALARTGEVVTRHATALNRRNLANDRDRAITILEQYIRETGGDGDVYGNVGRIHKDRYLEAVASGDTVDARSYLNSAIEAYRSGFEREPTNYYPGVNAVTLLLLRDDDPARHEVQSLLPRVRRAVRDRFRDGENNFWQMATALHLAIAAQDWVEADSLVEAVRAQSAASWMIDTTVRDLRVLASTFSASGAARVSVIVSRLEG